MFMQLVYGLTIILSTSLFYLNVQSVVRVTPIIVRFRDSPIKDMTFISNGSDIQ